MSTRARVIPPGSTIGMLGGGQLGRMSLLAGRRLGYKFHVYEPAPNCPAAPVAEKTFTSPWDDSVALADFADFISAVTLEFENVPAAMLKLLEKRVPARPGSRVLEIPYATWLKIIQGGPILEQNPDPFNHYNQVNPFKNFRRNHNLNNEDIPEWWKPDGEEGFGGTYVLSEGKRGVEYFFSHRADGFVDAWFMVLEP